MPRGTGRSLRMLARRAVLIALLVPLLAILNPSGATADPPYETDASIDSLNFTSEEVTSGSLTRLEGTWSLPDDPATPAGFVVDLPEELRGYTDAFDLVAPDGSAMGHCTVTPTQVICDLDSDYIAENPRDLHGDFNFWVRVETEVTETTEITYDIDELTAKITVNPPSPGCPDCEFKGLENWKWGWLHEDNTITWNVTIKAGPEGMAGGESVVVHDMLGEGQEHISVSVAQSNTVGIRDDGYPGVVGWESKPPSEYVVSDEGRTVSFTSEPGYFYEVKYRVRITDGGAREEYNNAATVTIGTEETVTVRGEVTYKGGGGTGSGDNVGRFSITRDVTGSGASEASDMTFSGTYLVTPPSGNPVTGTFTVRDDETWTSEEFPRGSTVHLDEDVPTKPGHVSWGAPEFSTNDFELDGGTVTVVDLVNSATIVKNTPKITTRTSKRKVKVGKYLRDRVTIRGFRAGSDSTGVAKLYGPYKSRAAATCRPAKLAGKVKFKPRNGTQRTKRIKVKKPGYYTWVAAISADSLNKAASHKCGLKRETSLVHKPTYQPPKVDAGFTGTEAVNRLAARRIVPHLRYRAAGVDAPVSPVGIRKGKVVVPADVHTVGQLARSAALDDLVGTTVIVGHVSDRRDRPGAMYGLARAKKGQVLTVTTAGKTRKFRVTGKNTFDRSKRLPKRLFATTSKKRLVLISCTGKVSGPGGRFHYTRNLVVHAVPVK